MIANPQYVRNGATTSISLLLVIARTVDYCSIIVIPINVAAMFDDEWVTTDG